MAVRDRLRGHEAITTGSALQVEVGGGSADISLLRAGEPVHSGTYPIGAIRLRQSFASWKGTPEQKIRLLQRHIQNSVEEIRREIPLAEVEHFIGLGGDLRFAARCINGEGNSEIETQVVSRSTFHDFCEGIAADDGEGIAHTHGLAPVEAETLVPALLATRALIEETRARVLLVPGASLRAGLLLDMVREINGHGIEDFGKQVVASAGVLGERYRYDAPHGRKVADLTLRIFDDIQEEHGLTQRHRLLLEVAALLHDIGTYVGIRAHHKHTQYLLSVSDIFGLSREDMSVISNVARYHRRGVPMKSHPAYMALDRRTRVEVNKLAAILRLANALDADHRQKVRDVRIFREDGQWTMEVAADEDLMMERLAALARTDLFTEVYGGNVVFRAVAGPA
jgi:exopolyphosphatase/guanosine-5'-triphosphate,3'-diphosphate pyrophosphatase